MPIAPACTSHPRRLHARNLRFATAALVLSATALVPAPASAQAPPALQKIRPGLWEHSVQMQSQSGQIEGALALAQKAMSALSPAQRQQMEQMMAAQGLKNLGLGGSNGAKGQTVQACITPAQAAMDTLPQRDGCTQNVQRVDASTLKIAFQCQGSARTQPTSGEGTVQLQGPTAYTGQFRIKTALNGKTEQIDMAQSGTWLSDQCGATKPVPAGR